MALQPYTDPDDPEGEQYPISPELIAAARRARNEAQKDAEDRIYQTFRVAIGLLIPADYNPRRISDFQLEKLKRSLGKHGMIQPIIVNTYPGREGIIIGGHQRLKAAHALGWKRVSVVWAYEDENDERALNIGLNQIGGEWDTDLLAKLLADLKDRAPDRLDDTGFDEAEVQKLLASMAAPAPNGGNPDEQDIELPTGETRVQPGDVWRLGRHRLVCGDARNWENWVALLGGEAVMERADAFWTDPPYGVSYVGKTKKRLTIQNDRLDEAGLEDLLTEAFANADRALGPGSPVYVCEPPGPLSIIFRVTFRAAGWRFHETLVWVKDQFVLGHSDYHLRHETIIYGYTQGGGRRGRGTNFWFGDNARTSVFEVPRPKASTEHPTTKPAQLVALMLGNNVPFHGIVVDCFAGAGCTVLACEGMNRDARAMELDPRYATVIVDRWEQMTGEKAVLVSRRGLGGMDAPDAATPRRPRAQRGAKVTEDVAVALLAAPDAPEAAYREA